jgi:glycosyltransferase involved in cell wall biosynthesis
MATLSLVIPCYNEAANLPLLIDRCKTVFQNQPVEVVLVDNGSTDNTADVVKNLLAECSFIRSVRVDKNQGYGYGILFGLRHCTADYIGWTHADMQTDPADVLTALNFIQQMQSEKLLIKGRRTGRPLGDQFFTIGMGIFETLLMQKTLIDINAQPTIFPKYFFDDWQDPPHDFSLDLYAYYLAKKNGLTIKRFSVKFGERAHGSSHWNINWRAKLKFIQRTLVYSFLLRKKLFFTRK